MKKLSIQNKISLITSILSIIISSYVLFTFYLKKQDNQMKYLNIIVYEDGQEQIIESRAYFSSFDIVSINNGVTEYLHPINSNNNKSVVWFDGYNGPEKLKRDATNKYFIINGAEFSFWSSVANKINYAWFKIWH